jgi:predicted peptidase
MLVCPVMKKIFAALFIILTHSACQADSGNLQSGSFNGEIKMPVGYEYLLSLPEGYAQDANQRWPMILFLHGSGERGNDLNQLKKNGPPMLIAQGQKIPAIVVAPQCKPEQIWNPHGVKALADEIQKLYRVDHDRVYLTGLSMGGYGTWDTAMEYPDEWAALVPICGGAGVRFIMASRIKHIPEWIFHGEADPVVPVEHSKKMHSILQKLGAKDVKLTIYPGVKHDSWTPAYADPELWKWLFEQKKAFN